jgi:hypothetical protein
MPQAQAQATGPRRMVERTHSVGIGIFKHEGHTCACITVQAKDLEGGKNKMQKHKI